MILLFLVLGLTVFFKLKKMDVILKLHYFTANSCSVCESMYPKIVEMVKSDYNQVELQSYTVTDDPKIAADFGVFTVPVLIFTVDGVESQRWVRAFGLSEVKQKMDRIISLI